MTLEHLLTMTSGLECRDSALSLWTGLDEMLDSGDSPYYVLSLPMESQPGADFLYCNGVSHMLSAILEEATGTTMLEFAEEHLFAPLGISDLVWLSDPQGITSGYSNLHLRPLDMAKFGYLFLRDGLWDGQQLIPVEWISESTRAHIRPNFPPNPEEDYGYQWWIDSKGQWYDANGYGGQLIYVLPVQNMVVVFTSGGGYWPVELLENYIMPSVISDNTLPENPSAITRLGQLNEQLATAPQAQPVATFSDKALAISGLTYSLENNLFDWETFSLSFHEDSATIYMFFADDVIIEAAIGLNNQFQYTNTTATKLGRMPVSGPLALRGFWEDENTFIFNLQTVGGASDVWFQLDFWGDHVLVNIEDFTSYITMEITGISEN
jgi:hypothetical protein